MREYMNLLEKGLKDADIKIVAFCMMPNHAHLLINAENIEEMSKFMQKVNCQYARYYNYMENRVGYVFRDRFKSEPIKDRRYLIQCAKYIHQNPVKAGFVDFAGDYKFSSYNYFVRHSSNHSVFSKDEIQYICNNTLCDEDFLEAEDMDRIDDAIKSGIEEFLKKEDAKLFEIFENRDILKKLILFLKEKKKIKYVDMRRFFYLSRGILDRLK